MNRLESIAIIVALVSTIGGFIFWAGKPPYANEAETDLKLGKLQLLYSEQRVDSLERRIWSLDIEKTRYKQRGEAWPIKMEEELRRLRRIVDRENRKIDVLLGTEGMK